MLNLLIAAYVGGLIVRLSQEYEVGDVTVADVGKAIVYPIEVVRSVTPLAIDLYNLVAKLWRKNAPPSA
jgi:hypothetical protein